MERFNAYEITYGDDNPEYEMEITESVDNAAGLAAYRAWYDTLRDHKVSWMDSDGISVDELKQINPEEGELVQTEINEKKAGNAHEKQIYRNKMKELYKQLNNPNKEWNRQVRQTTSWRPNSRVLMTDTRKRDADEAGMVIQPVHTEPVHTEPVPTEPVRTEPEIFNADCDGKTATPPNEIVENIHCLQCLPAATERFYIPKDNPIYAEWELSNTDKNKSMERYSFNDIPHTWTVPMNGSNHPTRPYIKKAFKASVMHWGQLKLLMAEIDFLTQYMCKCLLDPTRKRCKIVYAGASPGHHLPAMIKLFPGDWEWELIDVDRTEICAGIRKRYTIPGNILERQSIPPTDQHKIMKEYASEVFFNSDVTAELYKDMIQKPFDELIIEKYQTIKQLKPTKPSGRTGHIIHNPNASKCMENLDSEHAELDRDRETYTRIATFVDLVNTCSKQVQTKGRFKVQKWNGVNCIQHVDGLNHAKAKIIEHPPDAFLLLISDIRNRRLPDEMETVKRDMSTQYQIFSNLMPYQAMLKFKLPYNDPNHTRTNYPQGEIRYQTYSRFVSHETRLITSETESWPRKFVYPPDVYNHAEYEKRLYYFTSVLRTSLYKGHTKKPDIINHPTLHANGVMVCDCYDCYTSRCIMQNFIREREKAVFIKKALKSNPDRIAAPDVLKQDAEYHIRDTFTPGQIEDMALLLSERIVSQLAFVQAMCGGTDIDLDSGKA